MKYSSSLNEADLVVVGGGGSGLAAAIEAAERGCKVILIEKSQRLGGSTGWSVGSVSSSGTPHQARAGIMDNPTDHFEDMGAFCGPLETRDNRTLRRLLAENIPDTFRWLEESGVRFFGPMPEPPHRVPRMHNVVPTSGSFIYHLSRRARRAGVSIRTGVRARELIECCGRVVGIEAETRDGNIVLRASAGVILAGGDYSAPCDLRHAYGGAELDNVPSVSGVNTGDCHRMAMAFCAEIVNADLINGPVLRFVPPPSASFLSRLPPHPWLTAAMAWGVKALPSTVVRPFLAGFLTTVLGPSLDLFTSGAALVDRHGDLIDTTGNGRDVGRAVAQAPDASGYAILDRRLCKRFSSWPHFVSTAPGIAYAFLPDYKRSRRDLFHTSASLEGLSEKLGMNANKLLASIERSNNADRAGASSALRIEEAPFVALGPIRSYVVLTDGGLRISPRLEVLGVQGNPVPGLFAAGATGQGGLVLAGHGHHLGWAFTSGRLAARSAMNESLTPLAAAHA